MTRSEVNTAAKPDGRSPAQSELANAITDAIGICRIGLRAQVQGLECALRANGAEVMRLDELRPGEPVDAVVAVLGCATIDDLAREAQRLSTVSCESIFVSVSISLTGQSLPIDVRRATEEVFIAAGFAKHPAQTKLFGYEALGRATDEVWALFERPADIANAALNTDLLRTERDLHADMLREAGERSDAHVVRYQLAAELVRPGDIVLDAACGLGYGSHVLHTLSPAKRIVGIDLSPWGVEYAQTNYGAATVQFFEGSLPSALNGHKPASFDFVASLETLEHVADPEALLSEFYRVLRPGGRLFISVPNDWADETGSDPSPYHLHVYDWQRIHNQLSRKFIVERAWRLIASGCKQGPQRQWAPHARLIEEVPLDQAPTCDGEWWLVLASKSPLDTESAQYSQTTHGSFFGTSHLVDFAEHYKNPWLVASVVELPWRIQNARALAELSNRICATSPLDSADYGAALAVSGYRLLEADAQSETLDEWLGRSKEYLHVADRSNPHIGRWHISLTYLRGRIFQHLGRSDSAATAFNEVLDSPILSTTPTLGTKQVDAAWRLGCLNWTRSQLTAAREAWRRGVAAGSDCLHEDWTEFVGNWDRPFPSSLNDAAEILDGAMRCALALRATADEGCSRSQVGVRLASVGRQSLRSALQRLAKDLGTARRALHANERALSETQRLAVGRSAQLTELEERLNRTQAALNEVQALAIERYALVESTKAQLQTTQYALDETQALAKERYRQSESAFSQLNRTQLGLEEAQSLAREQQTHINAISAQLANTQTALEEMQSLARVRQTRIDAISAQLTSTQTALDETQALAKERYSSIEYISSELKRTQTALNEAQAIAHGHYAHLKATSEELAGAREALGAAQRLASERSIQINEAQSALERHQGIIEQLTRAQVATQAQLEKMENAHATVLQSWSWRLTLPFRQIAGYIRRFTKKS